MHHRTRELFARHGLRCTTHRQLLYETLRGCTTHPTAEELYRILTASGGSMSRATVYNALEALCRAGLIRRIAMPAGCCRFDGDVSDHLHVRIGDADIRDVPGELGQRLINGLPRDVLAAIECAMGLSIDNVHIQLVASADTTAASTAGR